MIDTHCHLDDPRLLPRIDEVLERARLAGVSRMITISTDLSDSRLSLALCAKYSQLRCALGIHPHNVSGPRASHDLGQTGTQSALSTPIPAAEQIEQITALAADPAVVAMGEIGLDYHYDFSPRNVQKEVFRGQLSAYASLNKPLALHVREAIDDALAMLEEYGSPRGVFHCFTGTADEARRILERGYFLSFTGVATFKTADWLREIIRQTPLDRLLLETDAPYLTPEPMRKQKTNEPAMLVHTAALVARLHGISVEELDQITTANAKKLFGW
jgi:TatD DNase family protein